MIEFNYCTPALPEFPPWGTLDLGGWHKVPEGYEIIKP